MFNAAIRIRPRERAIEIIKDRGDTDTFAVDDVCGSIQSVEIYKLAIAGGGCDCKAQTLIVKPVCYAHTAAVNRVRNAAEQIQVIGHAVTVREDCVQQAPGIAVEEVGE